MRLTSEAPAVPLPAMLCLRAPLLWREFDGEWVVMSQASGSLFQLDPVCAALLSLLETGASGADALLSALCESAGPTPPPDGSADWPAAMARALHHLRANDLIMDGAA